MLRTLCLMSFILISATIYSQTTKTPAPQKAIVTKPVVPKILKDLRDSASYTAGIHVVNKYRSQQIYNFNSAMVAKACNDLQAGHSPLLTTADADNAAMAYQDFLKTNPSHPSSPPVKTDQLHDIRDSASYAAGMYLINFFQQFDIINFNSNIISKAINDLQSQKKPLLNDSLANVVAIRYQKKLLEIKNKANIDAGKKFLAENKKRPVVKTTRTGLQYEIIKPGSGPKPTKKDKITCHYTGSFIDGSEFESSYKNGQPISFNVTQVIAGWTEALQLMPVGSKWKLYIPYDLAYGPGQYNSIPGGSVLIFELELLGIVSN